MDYNNSNIMIFGVHMKEILKGGCKLFLKTIAINIMCFFIVVSFSVITTMIFTGTIDSKLSNSGKTCFLIVSQAVAFCFTSGFIYPELWNRGTKDSNLVKFKHKNEDKLKGFKIGAVAAVPNYLFLVFLVIARLGLFLSFPMALYKLLNSSVYSFIDVIVGSAVAVSDMSVLRLALLFLLPLIIPAVSGISYILGYKNISVGEKFIYKKN